VLPGHNTVRLSGCKPQPSAERESMSQPVSDDSHIKTELLKSDGGFFFAGLDNKWAIHGESDPIFRVSYVRPSVCRAFHLSVVLVLTPVPRGHFVWSRVHDRCHAGPGTGKVWDANSLAADHVAAVKTWPGS